MMSWTTLWTAMRAQPRADNKYVTQKTTAQKMLDVSLVIASVTQLKHVIELHHQYYIALAVLLSISLLLQLIMAIGWWVLNIMQDKRLHLARNHPSIVYIEYLTTGAASSVAFLHCVIAACDPTLAGMLTPTVKSVNGTAEDESLNITDIDPTLATNVTF